MRSRFACRCSALVVGLVLLAACSAPVAASDPRSVAREAYIFGAPLVTTVRTLQSLAQISPVNQLTWQPRLADPQSRLVVAPNRDTVYVGAPMDLRAGPYVLTVPAIPDRYYTFQFLDAYTENPAYVGTRTNGGAAGTYLIAPSSYTGPTPDGMTRLGMPTLQFVLLGRFAAQDPQAVATVFEYRSQIRLVSLQEFQGGAAPAPPRLGAPAGPPQALVESGLGFFDELGAAMAVNPPTSKVGKRVARRMAKVGIGPGKTPSSITDVRTRSELEAGLAEGGGAVAQASAAAGRTSDGWQVNERVGTYGDDFLLRAVVSRIGWGANIPQEAIYAVSRVDAAGQSYVGTNRYALRFAPDQLPKTSAFWSITAYGSDLYLAVNPYDRYSMNSLQSLRPDQDGGLTVTFASTPVDGANWVPVPEGAFVLIFREYLPDQAAVTGGYHPPSVQRV